MTVQAVISSSTGYDIRDSTARCSRSGSRTSSGTPSISHNTWTGSGSAKTLTRSAGRPACSSASRCRSVSRVIIGSRPAVARMVNDRVRYRR